MYETKTFPGMHDQVTGDLSRGLIFDSTETNIVKRLATEWYITKVGCLEIGIKSRYKFALIKPTQIFQEMFNLEREIVVIFSFYDDFEPRTLDAFDEVVKKFQSLRLDKICYVLFSKDKNIEEKLRSILKQNQESQVIVPFSYDEFIIKKDDAYFLRNRFRKYFYSRDLFAFESPLKKDLYFFGRNDLIHKIVNRHLANENSGLFGLRKTGKTSVIFGIQRALDAIGEKSIDIDCQNTSFHIRRWNQALHFIVSNLIEKFNLTVVPFTESEYTELNASVCFDKDLQKISKALNDKSILIIFDEIENISYGISPTNHWEQGLDFIYFWQTIRSIFQKGNNVFTFLIVGTNPLCVESPTILGKDNPIFNAVPYEYIERFDVPETREMVRKLGRLMGLKFDEAIYAKLTEDYGGHPFLIRHVCSLINRMFESDRPTQITRIMYDDAKENFDNTYSSYIEMILSVLKEFYKDEYDMLEFLAVGDIDTFNGLALDNPLYISHLLGYGIISRTNGVTDFRIDAVKKYLIRKTKKTPPAISTDAKIAEISKRRNSVEPKLRKLLRIQLKTKYGENEAKRIVLDIMGGDRKTKYFSKTYNSLFDPNECEIYLEDLRKIVSKQWQVFEHIFSRDRENFELYMKVINKYRVDAHAKDILDEELAFFRIAVKWIEDHVEDIFS